MPEFIKFLIDLFEPLGHVKCRNSGIRSEHWFDIFFDNTIFHKPVYAPVEVFCEMHR